MAGDIVPRVEARRVVPVGDLHSAAGLLLLSVGSGVLTFGGLGFLCWALRWSVRVALGGTGLVLLAACAVLVLSWDRAWFAVETVSQGVDQVEALPTVDVPRLTVEVSDVEAGRWRFLDLPGTPEQLQDLAWSVMLGTRSLSEADWTGSGRPYSKAEFRSLRAQMLGRGLLTWRNPAAPSQGVELTTVGRAVFRRLADLDARAGTHTHATGGHAQLGTRQSRGGE